MVTASDAEQARVSAGELLQSYWTCYDDVPEELEEQEEQIRAQWMHMQAAEPDDATALVGMALLTFAKLREHVDRSYRYPFTVFEDTMWRKRMHGFEEDMLRAPTKLKGTDKVGRALAEEAVHTARSALELEPNDNVATFTLARSLEWLGDHKAAATMYRHALTIDPYDDGARSRLMILAAEDPDDVPARPAGENRPPTRHPHGFYVLELTELVSNSGSEEGLRGLLNDPDDVRSLADRYLEDKWDELEHAGEEDEGDWVSFAEWSDEAELALWSYLPGVPPLGMDLYGALDPTPDGRQAIDWSQVAMANPLTEPLPAGRPVRWQGELLFFGKNEVWS